MKIQVRMDRFLEMYDRLKHFKATYIAVYQILLASIVVYVYCNSAKCRGFVG